MATKSNDAPQIVMLTFFLCAIFFTGWGGYMYWKVSGLTTERKRENANQENLSKLLKDPKNKALHANFEREKKLKAEGKQTVAADIQGIIRQMGKNLSWIKSEDSDPKDLGNGLTELKYTVTFAESRMEDYVYLLHNLETQKPYIKVADLEINKKRGKNEDENSYTGKIVFMTYF